MKFLAKNIFAIILTFSLFQTASFAKEEAAKEEAAKEEAAKEEAAKEETAKEETAKEETAKKETAKKEARSWELISKSDGFITHRKQVKGSNIFAFRGETVTDAPISKLLSVFFDKSKQKDWIDRFGASADLEKIGPLERVYWIRFKTPFIISDRDYVLKAKGHADPEKKIFTINIKSIDHKKKASEDCCVRAIAYNTFYKFEVLPSGQTKIEVEVHTDPKGSIPSWLTNLIQKSWPKKTLRALIREAKKPNVKAHPDYKNWVGDLKKVEKTSDI